MGCHGEGPLHVRKSLETIPNRKIACKHVCHAGKDQRTRRKGKDKIRMQRPRTFAERKRISDRRCVITHSLQHRHAREFSGLLFDVAERIIKRWFQLRRFQLCLPKSHLSLFHLLKWFSITRSFIPLPSLLLLWLPFPSLPSLPSLLPLLLLSSSLLLPSRLLLPRLWLPGVLLPMLVVASVCRIGNQMASANLTPIPPGLSL